MKITFLMGHMVKERDLLLYELAEDLGEHGAKVTVISGYPSRRIGEDVRNYYLEHPYEKLSENVRSVRVGSKRGEGNGLFGRMLRYLSLSRAIVREAMKTETDVFYVYSTPPFLGYYIPALKKKAPVLYNAQDLFPDSLKTAKGYTEQNPLIRFFRGAEKRVYRQSDRIVTISEDMKKTILAHGGKDEKVSVIHNWADTETIKPIEKEANRLFAQFHVDRNKFTVVYAGNIGLHQRLALFTEAAKELQASRPDIQFVFFGNGAYADGLKERIEKLALHNFYVYPLQPVERIAEVYSMGDMDIVSLEQGMTRLALPSKLWSVMAAGRPMLALLDRESDMAKQIDKKLGLVIDGLSSHEVAMVICACADGRYDLSRMGSDARKTACEEHARKLQTQKYFAELAAMAALR